MGDEAKLIECPRCKGAGEVPDPTPPPPKWMDRLCAILAWSPDPEDGPGYYDYIHQML